VANCAQESIAANWVEMGQRIAKMFSPLRTALVGFMPCGGKAVCSILREGIEKRRCLV
jgi:hypothetical protein